MLCQLSYARISRESFDYLVLNFVSFCKLSNTFLSYVQSEVCPANWAMREYFLFLGISQTQLRCWVCVRSGNYLLSQAVTRQVSSTLRGLTSVFGMGTGGSPLLSSPDSWVFIIPSKLNNITSWLFFSFSNSYVTWTRMRSAHTSVCFASFSTLHTFLCLLATAKYTLRFVPLTLASQVVASLLRVYVDVCFANIFGQVLGLLVPVSYIHYCTSTSGLSTM